MLKLIKKLKPLKAHSTGNWTVCTLRFRRLSSQQQQGSEKGKVPSQSHQLQKGMHEIGSTNDPNVRIDEVKAVVTLRSSKELRPAALVLIKSAPIVADPPQKEQ